MTMQFLSATTDANGIHYSVWLDTTQGTQEQPDPAYVREYDYAPFDSNNPLIKVASSPPVYYTSDEYQQMTLDEVKLLAAADLSTIQAAQTPTPAPTPLNVQGQTF